MRKTTNKEQQKLSYISELLSRFKADFELKQSKRNEFIEETKGSKSSLNVKEVNFFISENTKEHHTEAFKVINLEPPSPVFRRGQSFKMSITFGKVIDVKKETVTLIFNFGPNPNFNKNTKAIMVLTSPSSVTSKINVHNGWTAKAENLNQADIKIKVNIPVTAPVGLWRMVVSYTSTDTTDEKMYNAKENIYILFNPWLKEDPVYLEKQDEIEEFVLNESGKVYMGSSEAPLGRSWSYGQFDDVVLPVTILLLEKSNLKHESRGSPVMMARSISSVINSQDEDGLIKGKWGKDFSKGISPLTWTGSVAIMEKYLESSGQPVKYGQCWVFAATAVTICRALGIPARPVTNYYSGHDTNSSLTIDKYYYANGKVMDGGPEGNCFDSIWNFHVWTEVWMKRPELPPIYSGWQVIDATPQEKSENMFKCGPASVEAVRRGEVGYLYDTPFVFAEINADFIYYIEDPHSPVKFSRVSVDTKSVGAKAVTKKVLKFDSDNLLNDMEDVTLNYKYPEDSEAERESVRKAIKALPKAVILYEAPMYKKDVKFEMSKAENIPYGNSFDVVLKIENLMSTNRNVEVILGTNSVFYTGVVANVLKLDIQRFNLDKQQKTTVSFTVTPDMYLDKLVEHNIVKTYTIGVVKETQQFWGQENFFFFKVPELKIEVSGGMKVGSECAATIAFINPLNRKLVECFLSVEVLGVENSNIERVRDIEPNESVIFLQRFISHEAGAKRIMVTFNSKPLTGCNGSASFEITE